MHQPVDASERHERARREAGEACAHCPCSAREDCNGRATPCCKCKQLAPAYRTPELFEEPDHADD